MNGVAEMKNPDNFNMDIPGFGRAFSGLGGMFGGFGADLANLGGNGSNSFS